MKKSFLLIPAILLLMSPCFAESTASKPSSVELTIYNQDFALVKENREMNLSNGISFLSVPDVASTIEPNSVAFKSRTNPNSVVVREQNYRYDVINMNNILGKVVGKEVTVERPLQNGTFETITGTLLSTPDNGIIIDRGRDGVIINPGGTVRLKDLPEGLVSRPTLVWKLETTKPGIHNTEISYLAGGLGWTSDYVVVVDPLDKYVDLTGWVTLTNNSGVTYDNATLNLMAGDVHRRKPQEQSYKVMYSDAITGLAAPAPQFSEKSFFEYHLYTLKDKTTVRDKETKQITLTTAAHIPARRIYIYDGRKAWWDQWQYNTNYHPGENYEASTNKKVNVLMQIVNSKDNNLGIPLPKGTIKVYKQEADANQHFVGEDEIDHTPKDEKIRLHLGDAFDIVGEHLRTKFRRVNSKQSEETFQISLRNHKDVPVTVVDVEHLLGDCKITGSSHKYFKKDASTVEIPVQIPANGEVKINYTVRTKW